MHRSRARQGPRHGHGGGGGGAAHGGVVGGVVPIFAPFDGFALPFMDVDQDLGVALPNPATSSPPLRPQQPQQRQQQQQQQRQKQQPQQQQQQRQQRQQQPQQQAQQPGEGGQRKRKHSGNGAANGSDRANQLVKLAKSPVRRPQPSSLEVLPKPAAMTPRSIMPISKADAAAAHSPAAATRRGRASVAAAAAERGAAKSVPIAAASPRSTAVPVIISTSAVAAPAPAVSAPTVFAPASTRASAAAAALPPASTRAAKAHAVSTHAISAPAPPAAPPAVPGEASVAAAAAASSASAAAASSPVSPASVPTTSPTPSPVPSAAEAASAPASPSEPAPAALAALPVPPAPPAPPARPVQPAQRTPPAQPARHAVVPRIALPKARAAKQSGNDPDHPIMLDDSQPATPISTRASAAAASAAANPSSAPRRGPSGPFASGRSSPFSCSSPMGVSVPGLSASDAAAVIHVVYPLQGPDQVVVTTPDFRMLRAGEFLNDTLIDFGLKLLYHGDDLAHRGRFHFFNTFFYTRYVQAGYAGVKSWTGRVDIFQRDYLVVPINDAQHWSLAIICFPRLFFQPPASEAGGEQQQHEGEDVQPAAAAAAAAAAPAANSWIDTICNIRSIQSIRTFLGGNNNKQQQQQQQQQQTHGLSNGAGAVLRKKTLRAHPREECDRDPFENVSSSSEEDGEGEAQPPRKKAKTGGSNGAAAGAVASPSQPRSQSRPQADSHRVPAILYLDSLLPPPERLYNHLTHYLQEEWAAKAAQAEAAQAKSHAHAAAASSAATAAAASGFSPSISPDSSVPASASAAAAGATTSVVPRSSYKFVQPPYLGGVDRRPSARRPSTSLVQPWSRDWSTPHARDDPPLYEMRVPEQQNGCDCGLYLIEYTERFCKGGYKLLESAMAAHAQAAAAAAAAAAKQPASRLLRAPFSLSSLAPHPPPPKFEWIFFEQWKKNFPHKNMNNKRKSLRDLLKQLSDEQAQEKSSAK